MGLEQAEERIPNVCMRVQGEGSGRREGNQSTHAKLLKFDFYKCFTFF